MTQTFTENATVIITPELFLNHWQGHRRLTRRVIEAFPDDKLFSYSIGGMRPFAALVQEMLGMAVPTLQGAVSGNWDAYKDAAPASTKEELLAKWDAATEEINRLFALVPSHRWMETDLAFGQWEGPIHWIVMYVIDNEIHHRGQGYVYLRSLGIQPPAFYER